MRPPGINVEFRLPTPAPERIARRALVLAALACRGELETHAQDPDARAIAVTVRDWLSASGLIEAFEAPEHALLDPPLGTLAPGEAAVAALCGEDAAVLAWSLALGEMPAIDVDADASAVAATLGWLDPGIRLALETVRLRPRTDLLLLAEALEVAHWRLADGRAASLAQFAAGRIPVAGNAAPLPLAPNGDLLIDGVWPAEAGNAAVAATVRRIHARRRALNWLLGQAADYASIRVDL
jgi:hypothetical protein